MTRSRPQLSYRGPALLGRRQEIYAPQRRIAIVCEGSCTEPYYLDGLRQEFLLSNIRVYGEECGSDPLSVVKYALAVYREDSSIDTVYCVIDRDEHTTFNPALQLARQERRNGVPITTIVSHPTFEYWYLLHFRFSRRTIVRTGGRSPGDNMIRSLKAEIPAYGKSDKGIFAQLKDRLPQALTHARRARQQARADGEPKPSTDMDLLVSSLIKLKEERDRLGRY
ncbi:RloB family protein [Sphingosinicellaceae bacterium]|nr:RloB family protein [Sphingosinicellaceae bacterium]